jgi:prevent-host-death family protein
MSTYSVTEAKNRLSELIDRALTGGSVTITRRGQPVVELKPVAAAKSPPRPITPADVEWVIKRRRGRVASVDAGTLIRQMRDEETH